MLRRSRTLGNGSVSRGAAHGIGNNPPGGGRRASAAVPAGGCDADGNPEAPGQQPSSRQPLRRTTSDTNAAAPNGTANVNANIVVRTKQRGGLAEPPTGSKPSALPVIRRTASSTDTLQHGLGTKPAQQPPPSAATRAAADTAWPVISAQGVGGIKSGRPTTMRRRNSLPNMPHPPEASAATGARGGGVRDRKKREGKSRRPAFRDNDDRILREEVITGVGVGVRPMPRPKSLNLGVRSSSFSSVQYYDALQAQEEIDREEARRKPRRRESRDGGSGGTSAVRLRERSKEPRQQRRTIHRSRSAHQMQKTTREERGRARRVDTPPSPAEAPGELRRSSSLGSVLWPVSPRSNDACGKDYLQQHRRKTRGRRERGRPRAEAAAGEGREKEGRIDIRAISAGRGVDDDSLSPGKRNSTPSSAARSRHRSRSRSRPRSLEWEEADREKIKNRVVAALPPAETAADGAAASARSAAADATAAAVRAARAADEAKETAKERAAMTAAGAGIRRRARGPVAAGTSTPETQPQPTAAGGAAPLAPSSVWVTRYLDFSSTFGLVFLLSDGSVGVLFKDNTKVVVDPAGETLEYAEPHGPGTTTATATAAAEAPRPSPTSSIHEAESGAGGRPQCSRPGGGSTPENGTRFDNQTHNHFRYRLDSFPFFLRKKVRILKRVREGLCLDRGGEVERSGSTGTADGRSRREPLTFIEKWQRAGDTHCFQLSHQVVQVRRGERRRRAGAGGGGREKGTRWEK